MLWGEPLMIVIQMSKQIANLIHKKLHWGQQGAWVPPGYLVVEVPTDPDEPVETHLVEVTEEDHQNPAYLSRGVKEIGRPRRDPDSAYTATPQFALLLEHIGHDLGDYRLSPGAFVAMRWWDDRKWYMDFLEVADGTDGETTLGFKTTHGSYGTIELAHNLVVISAGPKEWAPKRS